MLRHIKVEKGRQLSLPIHLTVKYKVGKFPPLLLFETIKGKSQKISIPTSDRLSLATLFFA